MSSLSYSIFKTAVKPLCKVFLLCAVGLCRLQAASAGTSADGGDDWTRIYAVGSPAVSEDGKTVYFTWAGTNWTASAEGGEAVCAKEFHSPFSAGAFANEISKARGMDPAVSPDGTRVAFRFRGDSMFRSRYGTKSAAAGEIWLFAAKTKSFKKISGSDRDCRCPVWLGDEFIAYIREDGRGSKEVVKHSLADGGETVILPGSGGMITFINSSKDGKKLLYRKGLDLWLASFSAGGMRTEKLVYHPSASWKRPPAKRKRWYDPVFAKNKSKSFQNVWNNDGNGEVAVATNSQDVIFTSGGDLWAVKSGPGTNNPVRLCGETLSHERDCVLSPDGNTLYFIRDWGDRSEIWTLRRKDRSKPWHVPAALERRRIVNGSDAYSNMALSPDGNTLSWTEFEGRLMLMPLAGPFKSRICEATPRGTYLSCEYEWSPDGKYIALTAADKNRNFDVWIIDVARALKGDRNAVNVSDHFGWDGAPHWSTDSKTLLFDGTWRESGKTLFKVDMRKKLSNGCSFVVKGEDVAKEKEKLPKRRKIAMPYFKAEQVTFIPDYYELALRIVAGRLESRFLGGHSPLMDKGRFMRYKDAVRNAATWHEFKRVMEMALGEIDASHLEFHSTDKAKKEWNIVFPKIKSHKPAKKIPSVRANRKKVEKETAGRWSYIRVGAMNGDAYDAFRNDLYRLGRNGRKGLIIDIRENTGGNLADSVASCLMMKPHGWSNWARGRGGYNDDHMRRCQFYGDIVLLIDEEAYSNGEMFAHMMKTFKRAVLVGRPTAGAVLSTVNYPLLDLGEFRIPQGVWFNAEGVSMENNGAEPDVRVDDTPEEWFNGRDSQLEKAIEIAKSFKQ